MRKNTRFFSRGNEGGSTILEVVVAMFILSTLGFGAWHAVGVSLRLAAKFKEEMLTTVRLLQLDDRLRGLAGRVYLPYWAPDGIVQIGDGVLSVPYLDGDVTKELSLTFREGILFINDGQALTQYPGFPRADFSSATDDGHHQYGLTVALEGKDGKSVLITARFGATPLGSLTSP
jgi:hypothetical protein